MVIALAKLGALKGVLLDASELADQLGAVDIKIEIDGLIADVQEQIEAEHAA